MTWEWIIFSLIMAVMICVIVIASLVKCYYCKKLKTEENIRKSDKEISDLLKEIDERYRNCFNK